jgi:hypothetical protein
MCFLPPDGTCVTLAVLLFLSPLALHVAQHILCMSYDIFLVIFVLHKPDLVKQLISPTMSEKKLKIVDFRTV